MRAASAFVAARARAVASLLDAHPDLPVPSFTIDAFSTMPVNTHLDNESQLDAWVARFDATTVVRPYGDPDGKGDRSFNLTHDGIEFNVWCQVDVRQVVSA